MSAGSKEHRGNLQIFGDSKILIKTLNKVDQLNSLALNKTLERIRKGIQNFTSYSFYHVLQAQNKEADIMANKGCLLAQGMLVNNDEEAEKYLIP